jgi:hypothetical protein
MKTNYSLLSSRLVSLIRRACLLSLTAGLALGLSSDAIAGVTVIPIRHVSTHQATLAYRTVKIPCTVKRLVRDDCGHWKVVTITIWKIIRIPVENPSSTDYK